MSHPVIPDNCKAALLAKAPELLLALFNDIQKGFHLEHGAFSAAIKAIVKENPEPVKEAV